MRRSIALVSGGMDSLVSLAVAVDGSDKVYPLHADYGQRTKKRELESFGKIVAHYRLNDTIVVGFDYLKKAGGSSLTDASLKVDTQNPEKGEIPSSYVPFRNTHLLSIAVSFAEVVGASSIYIGAVETDSSGYPDCTKEYIGAFNRLIEVGSKAGGAIRVEAPLINMGKKEIVELGIKLKAPFELSWSCYVDNDIACGQCQSCRLRLKGFREAGIEDPIRYKKV